MCVFVVKYEGREVRVGHAIVFFQRDFSLEKKKSSSILCIDVSDVGTSTFPSYGFYGRLN